MSQGYLGAKSNAEKRKLGLYRYSFLFVNSYVLMIYAIIFPMFYPNYQGYFDLGLEVLICIQAIIYIMQWNESLNLYIRQKFTVMLKSKSQENRLCFMARTISIGSKYSNFPLNICLFFLQSKLRASAKTDLGQRNSWPKRKRQVKMSTSKEMT